MVPVSQATTPDVTRFTFLILLLSHIQHGPQSTRSMTSRNCRSKEKERDISKKRRA